MAVRRAERRRWRQFSLATAQNSSVEKLSISATEAPRASMTNGGPIPPRCRSARHTPAWSSSPTIGQLSGRHSRTCEDRTTGRPSRTRRARRVDDRLDVPGFDRSFQRQPAEGRPPHRRNAPPEEALARHGAGCRDDKAFRDRQDRLRRGAAQIGVNQQNPRRRVGKHMLEQAAPISGVERAFLNGAEVVDHAKGQKATSGPFGSLHART